MEWLAFVLLALVGAGWLIQGGRQMSRLGVPIMLMGLAVALTTVMAVLPLEIPLALITWLVIVVMYPVFTDLDRAPLERAIHTLLNVLAVGGILSTVVAFVVTLRETGTVDYLDVRATSFVVHANVFPVLLLGAMALSVKRMLSGDDRQRRRALVWLGVGYLALVLTFSRGGWLAWLAGGVVLLAVQPEVRRAVLKPQWVAAGLVVVALTNPVVTRAAIRAINPEKEAAVSSGEQITVQGVTTGRWPVWKGAVRLFSEHPLTGVGPHNFGPVFMPTHGTTFYWEHAHNVPLTIAAEMGLAGLAALLGVAGTAGWMLWRAWQGEVSGAAFGPALAFAVALGAQAMLDYPYRSPGVILLALLVWNRLLPDYVSPGRWHKALFAISTLAMTVVGVWFYL